MLVVLCESRKILNLIGKEKREVSLYCNKTIVLTTNLYCCLHSVLTNLIR